MAESIADEFLAMLKERVESLVVGDPTDPAVQMGPVVNAGARKSILEGLSTARAQGASVVAGGEPYDDGELATGYFVPPTILELPAGRELDVWREELFGPVLSVRRAGSVEQAFELANDGEYGLSAALFTQDLTRALEGMEDLEVGILHVNSETAGADPHVPFGGAKKSGYGPKEQGAAAKDFFTHTTTVYLRGGVPTA